MIVSKEKAHGLKKTLKAGKVHHKFDKIIIMIMTFILVIYMQFG